MVLCHGYGSSKAGFYMPALANALAAAGVASLRFDFAGAASRMCRNEVYAMASELTHSWDPPLETACTAAHQATASRKVRSGWLDSGTR